MKTLDERDARRSLNWRHSAVSLLFILLGAFCFLKYLGWTWVVSGYYGLPSHAGIVLAAQRQSLIYFWAGLLVETALIAILMINIRFDDTELTGVLRTLARGFSALAIAVIGTMAAMFLLSWIGEQART